MLAMSRNKYGKSARGVTLCVATLTATLSTTQVFADLNQDLKNFSEDPSAFMWSRDSVAKYDYQTGERLEHSSIFPEEQIKDRSFIDMKDTIQKSSRHAQGMGRADIRANDRAENLVDELRYSTLQDMEEARLTKSYLSESPWSSDYWPIYKGGLANRYADSSYQASTNWKANRDYLSSHRNCSINQLSPAEKYDYLVGDGNWTLTKSALNEGSRYTQPVATWMGICHGWAPAAFELARPKAAIRLKTPSGQPIDFYPSDIKALGSLLWAKASTPTRFIGGRCNIHAPATDANGRVMNSDCFDTNPGTWHKAVVNQIGVSQRSMVFDATYDDQVWNQPVYGYEYTYFNPQTMTSSPRLSSAMVSRENFTRDKFKKYRSYAARNFVGVQMSVVYIAETAPNHANVDSPKSDRQVQVKYLYDLELDDQGNIIGGEWYTQLHPDFLWVPIHGAKPTTGGDELLDRASSWDGSSSFPAEWTGIASRTSSQGLPLATVVDVLFSRSSLGF